MLPVLCPRVQAAWAVVTQRASWGWMGMHSSGIVLIWGPAYVLIGLGVHEGLWSVWSEQGWALERVI